MTYIKNSLIIISLAFIALISCSAQLGNDSKSDEPKPNEVIKDVVRSTESATKKVEKDQNYLLEVEKRLIGIYKNVSKSVVGVSNIRKVDNFFYGNAEVPQGMGSGFIWDDQGHVVTNYHVVQGGDSFVISFNQDAKQYKAKLVGTEPKKDIAVLKLQELPKNLHTINKGASEALQVGQMGIAIGSPFGLDYTMTRGIISALNRRIDGIGGVKIHGMIQTDASINQGNSGGPLLDSTGSLIGMNTLIFSPSGASAGLGFAVPVDTIKSIVPQLIKHGKVIRPGLGITVLEDHYTRRFFGEKGVAIASLAEGSPAEKAGLKGMARSRRGKIKFGDLILKIDGKDINTYSQIYNLLDNYKVGDEVEVTYIRDEKTQKTKLKLKAY
ncbi:trypsin-like peptidase domain-containing protein [Bacteriovoracaceae bacterium]|nr:trypsin-like peptidase domain-containing protein [Bacteriovoracaceae bacterium]